MTGYSVVIPTVGRASLAPLLRRLAEGPGPLPAQVLVVNDRPTAPLRLDVPPALRGRLRLLEGEGRGPAAARNLGWRAATSEWVVFIDDDVLPGEAWREQLAADLVADAAAVQATLDVPLPRDRRATDWERQVAGLADAAWITADIAYRRDVLDEVGGFDERFPRAYREDADLAIRVRRRGHRLAVGRRVSSHPVGPADPWVSVRRQRGNADDALLRRLYGSRWRALGDVAPGRRGRHALVTGAAVLAVAALAVGRPRLAAVAGAGALVGTAEFAWRRIAPGPRTAPEVLTMLATSVAIPPAATVHWLLGWWRHRGATPVSGANAGVAERDQRIGTGG